MKIFTKFIGEPGGLQWEICKDIFDLVPSPFKYTARGDKVYKMLSRLRILRIRLHIVRYGDYARVYLTRDFSIKFGVQVKWFRHKAWAKKRSELEKRAEQRMQSTEMSMIFDGIKD